jgi:hypothetical protein
MSPPALIFVFAFMGFASLLNLVPCALVAYHRPNWIPPAVIFVFAFMTDLLFLRVEGMRPPLYSFRLTDLRPIDHRGSTPVQLSISSSFSWSILLSLKHLQNGLCTFGAEAAFPFHFLTRQSWAKGITVLGRFFCGCS